MNLKKRDFTILLFKYSRLYVAYLFEIFSCIFTEILRSALDWFFMVYREPTLPCVRLKDKKSLVDKVFWMFMLRHVRSLHQREIFISDECSRIWLGQVLTRLHFTLYTYPGISSWNVDLSNLRDGLQNRKFYFQKTSIFCKIFYKAIM